MQAVSQYNKDRWDKALDIYDFDIGEYVKLTHEGCYGLEPQYKGPYVVVDKNPDFATYKIETIQGKVLDSWIHMDCLVKVTANLFRNQEVKKYLILTLILKNKYGN
ncbi:hypothetical protein BDA99DRAFT_544289 [Phascolomyces articulosus]|uniref:Uncharacterized protein n=1 Tax=Phascolomyces articulosus TaxID=60185 RepID=A0AAD5P6W3_9FUNG|nr:hypothetical protein BDA99DRAFT_544289 [Phascolomyces articulosus]